MVSVFHLERLREVLQDFYEITHIRITVFDHQFQELVAYPAERPAFCQTIRSCEAGRAGCNACDQKACRIASQRTSAYIYRCHAGLTEAIMPLYAGKALVGYLLFGHIFSYDSFEEGWRILEKACAAYPVDRKQLKAAYQELPRISESYIKAAARVLHATASYLVLERMATLQEDSAAAQLDTYLSCHFTEPITSQSLCHALNIGRTSLYKLSHELYGCGISQQVTRLRMEKAKQLLQDDPEMSITQIAAECGYGDYNYFIAVFSRTVGRSPNKFRHNTNNR